MHVGAVDRGHRGPGQHARAERRGGAGEGDHEPGVVHQLRVPEDDAPATGAHGGNQPGDLVGGHPPGRRQRAPPTGHRHPDGVPEPAPGRGEGGDVSAGLVRHEERQPPDQVRRGRPHEDGAFAGALPGQADLAVGQVTQAAVHELGGPPAGARGEVGALQQDDGEPAARGVQRDSRAGHPSAHDDDVDGCPRDVGQCSRPPLGGQRAGQDGGHHDRSGADTGRL